MSTCQDFNTTFKYNLTCIFLSLRAKLKKTLCPRTPCKSNNCSECHLQTYDFQVLTTNLAESLMLMPKCPGMKLEKSIILTINGFQFLQVYEFWQKSNEFAIRTIEDQFLKKIYFFTILLRKPKFAKVNVMLIACFQMNSRKQKDFHPILQCGFFGTMIKFIYSEKATKFCEIFP